MSLRDKAKTTAQIKGIIPLLGFNEQLWVRVEDAEAFLLDVLSQRKSLEGKLQATQTTLLALKGLTEKRMKQFEGAKGAADEWRMGAASEVCGAAIRLILDVDELVKQMGATLK